MCFPVKYVTNALHMFCSPKSFSLNSKSCIGHFFLLKFPKTFSSLLPAQHCWHDTLFCSDRSYTAYLTSSWFHSFVVFGAWCFRVINTLSHSFDQLTTQGWLESDWKYINKHLFLNEQTQLIVVLWSKNVYKESYSLSEVVLLHIKHTTGDCQTYCKYSVWFRWGG